MLAAFVIAALAAAAVGLPADYLRRRAPATIAVTAGFVNAVLIIAMVAALAGTSVLSTAAAVPALVFGLIAGNTGADSLATRAWGPATKKS